MSIIPSAAPNDTNPTAALTPERIAEIKDLLKYESSIAFYSHRAKESMLLLVAGVECMRAELAARPSRAEVLAEAANLLAEIGTPIHGARTEHERGLMYGAERLRRMAAETSEATS